MINSFFTSVIIFTGACGIFLLPTILRPSLINGAWKAAHLMRGRDVGAQRQGGVRFSSVIHSVLCVCFHYDSFTASSTQKGHICKQLQPLLDMCCVQTNKQQQQQQQKPPHTKILVLSLLNASLLSCSPRQLEIPSRC